MRAYEITQWIKEKLLDLGFDKVGIASLRDFPPQEDKRIFLEWLEKGYYADMGYMLKTKDVRLNPKMLLDNAKSAVVCVINYGSERTDGLKFARYSTRRDYHRVFKKVLGKFVKECKEKFGGNYKVFSDSLPILERSLGRLAGIGWIGKNSMLISPKFGSYFLIGGFLTDLELIPDKPFDYDFCGRCNRCVEACPTRAILPNRTVDSNRCISYWTIEFKGDEIPIKTYGWVFGCDICQEVCPWNNKSPKKPNTLLPTLEFFGKIDAKDILNMDDKRFFEVFKGTPIMRVKLKGLKRNLKIAGVGFEPTTSGL